MRRSRVLIGLLLVALIGIVVAWLALSRSNPASNVVTPPVVPLEPKTETHELEARDVGKPTSLATTSDSGVRAEALATEPVPKHARPTGSAELHVHVFDGVDTDAKLENVTVELFDVFGQAQEVLSAEGNEVTFAYLAPGEYHVRAGAKDHGSGNRKLEMKPDEQSRDVSLGLVRTLRLRVRWLARDGTSIVDSLARTHAGMRVELNVFATYWPPIDSEMPWSTNVGSLHCRLNSGDRRLKLTRQRNGFDDVNSQVVEEVEAGADGTIGSMSAEATPPFTASAWFNEVQVDVQRIEPGAKEVVFTSNADVLSVTRATLKLHVVDGASGRPLAAAKVRVMPNLGNMVGWDLAADALTATTDGEGSFVMAGIAPGNAIVEVTSAGLGRHAEKVFLRAATVTDLGEIRLETPATIRVHTVDDGGKAVNVQVDFAPVDEHNQSLPHAQESVAWSGEVGVAELDDNLRRSRYLVCVEDERFAAPPILVDATAGSVETRIVVHPAVRVAVGFDPMPEVGSLARVVTGEGVPVRTRLVPPSGRMSFALAPGSYRLDLVENGATISGVPFKVAETSFVLEIGR